MRAALPFALAASLLAAAAAAQTPAPPALASAPPKKSGDTLSGVTVSPLPQKTCSSRDKACIALVVAELERDYPKQLEKFCIGREDNVAMLQMHADDNLPATRAPTAYEYSAPLVLKVACANVHKR